MAEGSGLSDVASISANCTATVAAGLVIPTEAKPLIKPPELVTHHRQPHAHSELESKPPIQQFQNLHPGPTPAEPSLAQSDAGLGWKVLDSGGDGGGGGRGSGSGDLKIFAAQFNDTRPPTTTSESGQNLPKQYAAIFDDGSEDGSRTG